MHKLALIGFGGVGQGFVEILSQKEQKLEKDDYSFLIVSICDLYKGSIHHDKGLDLDRVLDSIKKTGTLELYPDSDELIRGWSSQETIKKTNAKTIIEMTYTDVDTGQPAINHCEQAFNQGKNVVMTNKGPVALAYHSLNQLAKEKGVRWLFEGAVMSGTPAIRLPLTTLTGNDISEIKGILNGTTNYILTQMEDGMSYKSALKQAQKLGYAEANPSADVDGFDVLYKVLILANVVLGIPLKREDVIVEGLSALDSEAVIEAKSNGDHWKLIGKLKKTENGLEASVKPERLSSKDPLSAISGATNAITYTCDLSGPVTLVGAGAGIKETAFAVLIDLIEIERSERL
ncbi:homoserine dehydrogenase [Bacillus suaedae]|uniref:Homoserine dehydrogenase n=1 Tax=Halalkalibacter suaedae TaxID=2822140 RepID=A0A941AML6_9BACI|nr:homoserine dehydrogenase [Bacillus suaedae]MBP3950665.1 homoserine dehydrogenase [Bacillus suaedae]